MGKDLVEIKGFRELRRKIEQLGDDKIKRREMLKILRQAAKGTVRAARAEAPQSDKPHLVSGRRSRKVIQPGNLKKSIGNITQRKSRSGGNAVVYVGPRAKGKHDGWYGHFVHDGTRDIRRKNKFMARAYARTKGQVTADTEKNVRRYIQRQIDKLSAT